MMLFAITLACFVCTGAAHRDTHDHMSESRQDHQEKNSSFKAGDKIRIINGPFTGY